MRYIQDTPLELGHRPWKLRPPQASLTLLVKGTFDLVPDGVARFAEEALPPTGEVYYDDDVERGLRGASDFALIKPRAECLVVGKAYTPRREPQRMIVCGFRVGPVKKRFAVVGDRRWERGVMAKITEAEPFTEMELGVERAYGGSGFDANPLGVGRGEVIRDGVAVRALPNLERPDDLIDSPSASPDPVIVGPRPQTWPARRRLAGTYDRRYVEQRWPWLPEDLDFAYFLEGPPDQSVSGFFRGDEAIELTNLHPEMPEVRSRLPGVQPRVFLDLRGAAEEERFEEVPLQLDTVVWDSEIAKLLVVWRGIAEVDAEDERRLPHIFLSHDTLDATRDRAEHWRRFKAILASEQKEEERAEGAPPPALEAPVVTDFDEAPATTAVAMPRFDPPLEESEASEAAIEEAARMEALDARLLELGIVPASDEDLPPVEPLDQAPVDPEALRAQLRDSGVEVSPEMSAMLDDLAAPEEAKDVDPAGGSDFELAPGTVFDPMAGPPIRERIKGRIEAGESLRGLDLTGVDLSRLDLGGLDLTGAILRDANLGEANLSRTNLERAVLRGAHLTGAILHYANLSEADLGGVTAERADFSGAFLEDADLEGARLGRAIFRQARGARVSLLGADLTEAILFEGDFLEADLQDAHLVRADVARCRLTDANLEGVLAHGARFDGSEMIRSRGEGLRAKQARFRAVSADDSFWERAELSESVFDHARLTRADFSDAVLLGTRFDACVLRQARFDRCNALRLRARKTDLFEACFQEARLSYADLRGSNLYTAELWMAQLDHLELENTNLDGTLLAR